MTKREWKQRRWATRREKRADHLMKAAESRNQYVTHFSFNTTQKYEMTGAEAVAYLAMQNVE